MLLLKKTGEKTKKIEEKNLVVQDSQSFGTTYNVMYKII